MTAPDFLRNINCHSRIQSILKSFEKASSSKINISKIQALWAGTYIKKHDKSDQMVLSQLSIKIFGAHFDNSILENNTWDIIIDKLAKTSNNKHD